MTIGILRGAEQIRKHLPDGRDIGSLPEQHPMGAGIGKDGLHIIAGDIIPAIHPGVVIAPVLEEVKEVVKSAILMCMSQNSAE